jgi:hypothetical protein
MRNCLLEGMKNLHGRKLPVSKTAFETLKREAYDTPIQLVMGG